ncbi:MAG: DUF6492 family protein [Salinisphaeraceae bacterium]
MSDICFLTPTYRGDYKRFVKLRRTMEKWAPEIPHYAVVQTEDIALFENIEFQKNLKLLTTRQILPQHIERARQWRVRGKPLRQKYLHAHPTRKSTTGWRCQQFVKLLAHEFVQEKIIVCIDSDVLLTDRFDIKDFRTDERTHLFSCIDADAEMASWLIDTLNYFGLQLQGKPISRYIYAPLPLDRDALTSLARHMQRGRKLTDKHWLDVVIRRKLKSEYTVYGVFLDHLKCSHSSTLKIEPSCTTNIWWHSDIEFAETSIAGLARRRYLLIQSNLDLPESVIEAHFEWAMN